MRVSVEFIYLVAHLAVDERTRNKCNDVMML